MLASASFVKRELDRKRGLRSRAGASARATSGKAGELAYATIPGLEKKLKLKPKSLQCSGGCSRKQCGLRTTMARGRVERWTGDSDVDKMLEGEREKLHRRWKTELAKRVIGQS